MSAHEPPSGPRLRVLHVLEALEGGTARHVVDLVRHVEGVDHEIVLPPRRVGGLTDTAAADAMVAAGAGLHRIDLRRAPVRAANGLAVARLSRIIRERRPAVLHAHSSIGGLVGRLAARANRIPVVYTPNGITTVRAGVAVERILGWTGTDCFVAVSESEYLRARELRLASARKLVVIPNGIDLQAPAVSELMPNLRSTLGIPTEAPLVGSISRLVAQKAPVDLVCAFAAAALACPGTHFVVIGDGPLRKQFEQEVARHGLQGVVHHIPYLPNAAAVLDQLDVFVLASGFEGAPYAPMEAMRAGTAVVATDVVGTRDVIDHGASGLLAPPQRPEELGRLVAELLADPAQRASLCSGAARKIKEFDVRLMGQRVRDLYLALMTGADF